MSVSQLTISSSSWFSYQMDMSRKPPKGGAQRPIRYLKPFRWLLWNSKTMALQPQTSTHDHRWRLTQTDWKFYLLADLAGHHKRPGKTSAWLLVLHQTACPRHALFSCHLLTRPWNTLTPTLGAAAHSQTRVGGAESHTDHFTLGCNLLGGADWSDNFICKS